MIVCEATIPGQKREEQEENLWSHAAKRRPIKRCHPNWMAWRVSYTEQCYLRLACRHLYLAGSFGGLV